MKLYIVGKFAITRATSQDTMHTSDLGLPKRFVLSGPSGSSRLDLFGQRCLLTLAAAVSEGLRWICK